MNSLLIALIAFLVICTGFIVFMIVDLIRFNIKIKKYREKFTADINKTMDDFHAKTIEKYKTLREWSRERVKQMGNENAKLKAENERLKERLKDLGLYTDDKY